MPSEGFKDSVWRRATAPLPPRDYKHLIYHAYDDGISILRLNRPDKLNAFNAEMKDELRHAICERFNMSHSENSEKALIITGSGDRAFSAGEDIADINTEWNTFETSRYVRETLTLYHDIIKGILCSTKPVIAALNGMAAGAGFSIALACDERFAVHGFFDKGKFRYHQFIPGFAGLGLAADSGITLTLSQFLDASDAKRWLETPEFKISFRNVTIGTKIINTGCAGDGTLCDEYGLYYDYDRMVKNLVYFIHQKVFTKSPTEYAASKEQRNREILRKLTGKGGVFEWEINAQTACLISDFTRQKIREFQKK